MAGSCVTERCTGNTWPNTLSTSQTVGASREVAEDGRALWGTERQETKAVKGTVEAHSGKGAASSMGSPCRYGPARKSGTKSQSARQDSEGRGFTAPAGVAGSRMSSEMRIGRTSSTEPSPSDGLAGRLTKTGTPDIDGELDR